MCVQENRGRFNNYLKPPTHSKTMCSRCQFWISTPPLSGIARILACWKLSAERCQTQQ